MNDFIQINPDLLIDPASVVAVEVRDDYDNMRHIVIARHAGGAETTVAKCGYRSWYRTPDMTYAEQERLACESYAAAEVEAQALAVTYVERFHVLSGT